MATEEVLDLQARKRSGLGPKATDAYSFKSSASWQG